MWKTNKLLWSAIEIESDRFSFQQLHLFTYTPRFSRFIYFFPLCHIEIEDLPSIIQEQLFEEILDKDVQQQLEAHPPVINWSLEVTSHLGSRLYALWNRSAGDCLLDSVMQATWGVFDRESTLRRAMADALTHPHSGHM